MAETLGAPGPGQPEIDRLFSDPAFGELRTRGGPAFLFSADDTRLTWANEAARRQFGPKLDALPSRLVGAGPISGPNARLTRLLIESSGGTVRLGFLTKRADLSNGSAVVIAALLGTAPALLPGAVAENGPAETPTSAAEPLPRESEAATAESTARVPSAEEVRAGFLRSRRNPIVRFLWQTDEAGRVTSVTPPLGEIVGAANADLVGRELAEIVDTLQLDPSGTLLTAMRVPETWSGIEVAWPIAGAAATVPVDLGGFPVFDTTRAFRGFRGFGVIHLDRIHGPEPLAVRGESNSPVVPVEPGSGPNDKIEATPPAEDAVEEPPASPADTSEIAVQPAPGVAAPNVVPLRPFSTVAGASGFRPPSTEISAATATPASGPWEAASPGSLSASEHQAFDEIGRRLKSDEARPGEAHPESPERARATERALAILDRLPLGVLVSRDEVPVYANRTLLDLAGYPSTEHLQKAGGLAGLFEGSRAAENRASATWIRTRQSELVPVETKLQTISWDNEPASLLTLRRASDGAQRAETRSLELELEQRNTELRELRAVLDTATDGVAIVDADRRILSLNRSAEALFGYQQNEIAGEAFMMLVAAESRRFVEDCFERLKSGARSSSDEGREVFAATRRGETIPVSLTLGNIDRDQPGAKFCAVIRDTSASNRVEVEAREAREEAERASAVKTDFLAKVSHEIRTPLNAIIGFAEVIMDERLGPIGTERYKDYLRDIHKSGMHVMSLVNDLLDLSKIEAGKMVLDIKSVDANPVVSECVALMQPQANRERVIMRLALAPRLVQIAADERSVRQIVLNLLSNAVKYNEPGGQVIVSTAMTETGQVAIRIKDTGIGMSDAEVALALEPFRQVATARAASGTGLGLPLTKALVEANRANFTIRSRKNEGTLVEVSFPPARILAESA